MEQPCTPEDRAAVVKAALDRRDYVLWLAKALDKRSADHGVMLPYDADMMRAAAEELRALVE